MKSPLRAFLLIGFITITTLIIAGASTLSVALEAALYAAKQPVAVEDKSTNLDNAKWTIVSATPVAGKFSLKLKSDIGNLKEINEVRSYAISNSGLELAISTAGGVKIVRLADGSAVEIAIPFAYTGDVGKAFSWSHDDAHIAIVVSELADATKKHLLTFTNAGEQVLDIQRNFAGPGASLFPAKFSTHGNYLLTVVDESNLVVFDALGDEVVTISTAKQTNHSLFYFWDEENGINYAVLSPNQEVNFSDEAAFTRVHLIR